MGWSSDLIHQAFIAAERPDHDVRCLQPERRRSLPRHDVYDTDDSSGIGHWRVALTSTLEMEVLRPAEDFGVIISQVGKCLMRVLVLCDGRYEINHRHPWRHLGGLADLAAGELIGLEWKHQLHVHGLVS